VDHVLSIVLLYLLVRPAQYRANAPVAVPFHAPGRPVAVVLFPAHFRLVVAVVLFPAQYRVNPVNHVENAAVGRRVVVNLLQIFAVLVLQILANLLQIFAVLVLQILANLLQIFVVRLPQQNLVHHLQQNLVHHLQQNLVLIAQVQPARVNPHLSLNPAHITVPTRSVITNGNLDIIKQLIVV
jgi:ABC-type multidrug transport system fused ATPase/permease subunit